MLVEPLIVVSFIVAGEAPIIKNSSNNLFLCLKLFSALDVSVVAFPGKPTIELFKQSVSREGKGSKRLSPLLQRTSSCGFIILRL